MSSWSGQPEIRPSIDSKGKAFLTIAVICSIAFLSTWGTGLIVQPESNWPIRYRFLGVAFALGMACMYLWERRVAKQQIAAQRYLQRIGPDRPGEIFRRARSMPICLICRQPIRGIRRRVHLQNFSARIASAWNRSNIRAAGWKCV